MKCSTDTKNSSGCPTPKPAIGDAGSRSVSDGRRESSCRKRTVCSFWVFCVHHKVARSPPDAVRVRVGCSRAVAGRCGRAVRLLVRA